MKNAGKPNSKGGANLLCDQFSWKLHENEEILVQMGMHVPCTPRSTTDFYLSGLNSVTVFSNI